MSYQQLPPGQPAWQPMGQAPYLPPAPPPRKKSSAPLIVGIIAGSVVVLCLGAVLISALLPDPGSSGSTADDADAGSASGQVTGPGLNKPVRDGRFQFGVKKVTCGKTREGDSQYNTKPQGQFCEVSLSVENIGKQPVSFDSGYQQAVGTNGASFAADYEAEEYANLDHDDLLDPINPGNTATGIIVFDIPKDAQLASLVLHESSSTDGVTVKLT